MQYEVQSVDLTADITRETGITAKIEAAQPLAITFGKLAEIDARQAIIYVESGKKEVQAAVADGIADIETAAANMANKDLSNLSATGEAKFAAKQNVINDLSTIRSGAAAGATAVQPSALATVATTGAYGDLSGKPAIPAAQVNSDWNATSGVAKILNKPSLATVATSGSYVDLSNKPDLSSYAANNAVVHLADSETITGAKTFHASPSVQNSQPKINLKSSTITKGTAPASDTELGYVVFHDSENKEMGKLRYYYNQDKTSIIRLSAYKANAASDSASTSMSLVYKTDGTIYGEVSAHFQPSTDNSRNLGTSSYRWKQLYAGTTTIATSDEREKQNIEIIPDAVLDAWGKVEFYRYKFKDAVAQKGEENARCHIGLIAQRIESVFAAHGLNAFAYGLLCYDEWEAQAAEYDENGDEITPARAAGNRYALRYEECLNMEAAYQRRRADRIEARLAALEARV